MRYFFMGLSRGALVFWLLCSLGVLALGLGIWAHPYGFAMDAEDLKTLEGKVASWERHPYASEPKETFLVLKLEGVRHALIVREDLSDQSFSALESACPPGRFLDLRVDSNDLGSSELDIKELRACGLTVEPLTLGSERAEEDARVGRWVGRIIAAVGLLFTVIFVVGVVKR